MRSPSENMPLLRALAGAAALLFTSALAVAGESDPQDFTQIKNGQYLAILSDCASCHTVPGHRRFAGGLPIETPFGNIVAPNITPDRETGVGAWSDDEFDAAVRRGVRRDGALLYPAMPYNADTKMTREEVLAIRAYLNTVEPVHHAVVANTLPFPFNVRFAMRVWDALYFTEGVYPPAPPVFLWESVDEVVAHSRLETLPMWLLGTDRDKQRNAQGLAKQSTTRPDVAIELSVGKLAQRDYAGALQILEGSIYTAGDEQSAGRLSLLRYLL